MFSRNEGNTCTCRKNYVHLRLTVRNKETKL